MLCATDEKTLQEGLTFEQFQAFVHTKPVILKCFAAPLPEREPEAEVDSQAAAEPEQVQPEAEVDAEDAAQPEPEAPTEPKQAEAKAEVDVEQAEAEPHPEPAADSMSVPHGVRLSAPGSE